MTKYKKKKNTSKVSKQIPGLFMPGIYQMENIILRYFLLYQCFIIDSVDYFRAMFAFFKKQYKGLYETKQNISYK